MADKKKPFSEAPLEDSPKDELTEMLVNKCILLQSKGKNEEALACTADLTKKKPNLSLAWYFHGLNLLNIGHYDEAIISFNKAVELNKKDWMSITTRGFAKFFSKNINEAKNDFDLSLKINPKDVPTLVFAAFCSIVKGDKSATNEYIKQAYSVNPEQTGEMYSSFLKSLSQQPIISKEDKAKLIEVYEKISTELEALRSAKKKLKEEKESKKGK